MFFSLSSMAAEGERPNVNFNHDQTTFPLRGLHSNTACESCHINGVFKGTPNTCEGCHSRGGASTAKLKPATHIPVVADCSSCHIAQSWLPARFSHNSLTQSCATCHNGTSATGKPSNHIFTRGSCDSCHRTSAWVPANFSHDGSMTDCKGCHLTGTATKMPIGHIAIGSSQCSECHQTSAWSPTSFNHTGSVTACSTCHDGAGSATHKPAGHLNTSLECSSCHATGAWVPANFKHTIANVGAHSCSDAGCHSSLPRTIAPPSHGGKITGLYCDDCHRVTTWHTVVYLHAGVSSGCANCHNTSFDPQPTNKPFGHTSATNCEACHGSRTSWASSVSNGFSHAGRAGYFPHAQTLTCMQCHKNLTGGLIPNNGYKPNCAWCHASRFRAGSHVKTQSPNRVLYTVSDLQDCTGACHEYTTSTSGVIKTRKVGHHRSTDGGW